jgi:thiamine kinase-like enzyme
MLIGRSLYGEYANSRQAYLLGIGAKLRYFDLFGGASLFEYIKNEGTLEKNDLKNVDVLTRAVVTLKKLHSSKVAFNCNANMFRTLNTLAIFFNSERAGEISQDLEVVIKIVRKIKRIFDRLDITLAPCHGDPNPNNFLKTAKGMYLIDWEYSGNNDPAWDLAFLSVGGEFDREQDLLMMKIYGNQKDKTLFERIAVYKALVQLWRFFWARFQIKYIDNQAEKERFLDMSLRRYNDYKKILSSDEFKRALDALKQI